MKKLYLSLFFLSTLAYSNDGNFLIKVGGDFGGKFNTGSGIGARVDVVDQQYFNGDLLNEDADNFGYEIALEYSKAYNKNIEFGLGIAYQDHGSAKKNNHTLIIAPDVDIIKFSVKAIDDFKSIPVYFIGKYKFDTDHILKPYLLANIGYSFNFADDAKTNISINNPDFNLGIDANTSSSIKNGMYFAFGGGLEYNNFIIELSYKINEAEISSLPVIMKDQKADYTRTTLSLGYKF